MAVILVVDDSAPMRAVMKEMLTDAGHRVVEAKDGIAAEKCCRNEPFDLVISDIFMPEKEGMSTIRDLRKSFPHMKILAVSGGDAVTEPDAFLNLAVRFGADAVLAKPFQHDEFLAKVRELLRDTSR